MLVLAGDVGGTKTLLALAERRGDAFRFLAEERFESGAYRSLGEMVRAFLAARDASVERACFGVAGPVVGDVVEGPNLPWKIDRERLVRATGAGRTALINDFEAAGNGIGLLDRSAFAVLQEGRPDRGGPVALLGAGTGLGEAFLFPEGNAYRVHPTEGGHADFAPRNALEYGLLLHLRERLGGHVSVERVLSGSGLAAIYDYLAARDLIDDDRAVRREMERGDRAAVITRRALDEEEEGCGRALDLFVSIYGAEAGNQALRILATGGVVLGGGIAPKIVSRLRGRAFLSAFLDKGRFSSFLEGVSVRVILSARAPLLGAAAVAFRSSP